ncbi:MAG: glycerol-3-phosphate dehydrogenase/oxidase [Opitutae bacterium]|nr:glycerol-3-phosphate dehydrogenase/oxidase [Opitutae bacterium]
MNRDRNLRRLAEAAAPWDVLVIGGGATGLGVAVDAATRGYRTALVEQSDFAKGTSSRSTKLAHGGVRYLRSGEIGLVRGALRERGLLERNAPHLVRRQPFVIPIYRRLDLPLYGLGLKAYEWLSGRLSFGASQILSVAETRRLLPTVKPEGLRGGVLYFDGQFDDARLALTLARTADAHDTAIVNYACVDGLLKENGRLRGAVIVDAETGARHPVAARVVVNATGIFTDEIRRLDEPTVEPMLAVSSGVHLTLDRSFLPGDHALMIPRTSDGRVLFAVPWQGHVILGTTDEPRAAAELEPRPLEHEIEFLLEHAAEYLTRPVTRADVQSVFTGLRPLVRAGNSAATASLSRDHVIAVSPSGLVSITGGKWTSYRKMAEDAVARAAEVGGLPRRPCATENLRLHGASSAGLRPTDRPPATEAIHFAHYGTDARALERLAAIEPSLDTPVHPRLALRAVEVVWAARTEMARTIDDVLSRRSRALQLDARAALEAAPAVAALFARELGRDRRWIDDQLAVFDEIAHGYLAHAKEPAAPHPRAVANR